MRELTNNWYLKKVFFNYIIMVEIKYTTTCPYDLSESPIFTKYQKATKEDLIKLKINCV